MAVQFGGRGLPASPITNALAADVALSNASNFFDGPTVAQGTVGTWWASGTVTLIDTVASGVFYAKLWDGTTVIASARVRSAGTTSHVVIALSGFIANPAANIRISVKDTAAATGLILANTTGESKDSTVSVLRIA